MQLSSLKTEIKLFSYLPEILLLQASYNITTKSSDIETSLKFR